MTVKGDMRKVLERLEALKAREYGQLEQLAVDSGRGRGYITKLHKTDGYTFRRLLTVIALLRETPARFFARAYDISPDPETYLEDLLRPEAEEAVLGRIERVTRDVERQPPPEGRPSACRARVEALTRSSRSDQRKRLRNAKKFQTPGFLRRYLVRLDDLRYDRPADAAYLAETLVRDVVVKVIASRTERVELQCRALGVYGSAHRMLGNFATAARAIVLGLEVARRHDLEIVVAELLQRGAYLLQDQTEYERALRLLNEAHVIYHDLGMAAELGRVLVDRASMFSQQGKHEKSKQTFMRALEILPDYEQRWILSAYQGIALAYRQLGDADTAGQYLDIALRSNLSQGGSIIAKLLWLKGLILGDRGHHRAATQRLHEAFRMLSARRTPLDAALLSLDLTSSLLKEGKRAQALAVVRNMTVLTVRFRGNKLAESTLVELIEAGLHGRVGQELIDEAAEKLRRSAPKRGRASCKP